MRDARRAGTKAVATATTYTATKITTSVIHGTSKRTPDQLALRGGVADHVEGDGEPEGAAQRNRREREE